MAQVKDHSNLNEGENSGDKIYYMMWCDEYLRAKTGMSYGRLDNGQENRMLKTCKCHLRRKKTQEEWALKELLSQF